MSPYIPTELLKKQIAHLCLTFTAEVPVKYTPNPSQGNVFCKFHRVPWGVPYL